jgi:hypothetical protein
MSPAGTLRWRLQGEPEEAEQQVVVLGLVELILDGGLAPQVRLGEAELARLGPEKIVCGLREVAGGGKDQAVNSLLARVRQEEDR